MVLMAFVMVHDRVPRESPWGESQICRAGPPPAAGGEAAAPSTHVPRGAGPGPPPLPAGIQQGGAYTWNSRLTHAAPLLAQSQPPVAAGGTGHGEPGFGVRQVRLPPALLGELQHSLCPAPGRG